MFLLELIVKKKFPPFRAPWIVGWLYLLAFHTLSLIAFRANSMADLSYIYRHIFSFEFFGDHVFSLFDNYFQYFMLLFLCVFLFVKEFNEEFALVNRYPLMYKNLKPAFYIALIWILFMIGDFNANTFIYFQF